MMSRYWIIGFRGNFLIYLGLLIMASLCGAALGLLSASLFENVAIALGM